MFNYVKNLKSSNYCKLTFSIFFVWKVLSESLFNWCWQNFKFLLKLTFYPDSRIQIWLFTGSSLLQLSESKSINRITTFPALWIRIHQAHHNLSSSLNPDPSTGSSLLQVSESGSRYRILTSPALWIRILTSPGLWIRIHLADHYFSRSLNPDTSNGILTSPDL